MLPDKESNRGGAGWGSCLRRAALRRGWAGGGADVVCHGENLELVRKTIQSLEREQKGRPQIL